MNISDVVRAGRFAAVTMDNVMEGGIADRRFRALQRDDFTCAGCGCRSSTVPGDLWCGLEVHHLDDDSANNDLDNLLTLCPLCHGLVHLDIMLAGGSMPGRFLWLPRVPQSLLNMLVHVTAVAETCCAGLDDGARDDQTALALAVRGRCRLLYQRVATLQMPRGVLVSGRGHDIAPVLESHPEQFGRALGDCIRSGISREERERVARGLAPLRWLYDWRSHAKAAAYAQSDLWLENGRWPVVWTQAGLVLERMLREHLDAREDT